MTKVKFDDSKKDIFKKVQDFYEEMVLDLGGGFWHYYNLGEDVIGHFSDKEWARVAWEKAEKDADESEMFTRIGHDVGRHLGDKEWTRRLFIKAEEMALTSRDYGWLAEEIMIQLKEREWAKKLYEKSYEIGKTPRDLWETARSISVDYEDKEWAAKVYAKALECASKPSDMFDIAESVKNYLGDKKWASDIFKKAEEIGGIDFYRHMISDHEMWVRKKKFTIPQIKAFLKKTETKTTQFYELLSLAGAIKSYLGDEEKEWMMSIYQKAEIKAVKYYEYLALYYLIKATGDKNYARKIKSKAKSLVLSSGITDNFPATIE